MQDDLVKNYNIKTEKTTVIYNPVEDLVNEQTLLPQHSFRYKFLTVGRLSPEKGIDRLLKALSLLTIDFSFYIIGDGPEMNNLKALTADLGLANKIFFEGARSEPYENMSDAALFLIGSHYEGLPNAVLEAGMLGIPVVGFDSPGGISEIINDGVNGFLINDDGSGKAFSDAITKSLSYNFNKKQIREMTKNKFSVHRIMGQIENCFENIYKNNHVM
jgi:glycosyltransferase involved in cell wall biosynthesis